jgi:chemotaxis protein histidine kinase CheA
MFMSLTRPRRDEPKDPDLAGHLILQHVGEGMFVLDAADKVLEPISASMHRLFGQRDLLHLSFAKMLQPIVSEKTLIAACDRIAEWRKSTTLSDRIAMPLHQDIEVKLPLTDGSSDGGHYAFDFFPLGDPKRAGFCLVRILDNTSAVRQARDLEDLGAQLATQAAILRSVLRLGRVRFRASVQRTDAAMTAINAILKKPAREQGAFRNKLEETLEEVGRIRREGSMLQLPSLEQAAREFENSLHAVGQQGSLSGSDFLPLALKLDELFSEFALLRAVTKTVGPAPPEGDELGAAPAVTPGGTQILEAPQFLAQMAAQAQAAQARAVQTRAAQARDAQAQAAQAQAAQAQAAPAAEAAAGKSPAAAALGTPAPPSQPPPQPHAPPQLALPLAEPQPMNAPAGTLEHTLRSLTEHVADEQHKCVELHCRGLHKIPAQYERAAKYVAIQLIRNAVVHGIETPDERAAAGKSATGMLHLLFFALPNGSFELRFQDDGRGIDAEHVREVAVQKGLIGTEEAAALRDRHAIKLIFRGGFTTLTPSPTEPALGTGLSLVRRYVSSAGGKIALASEVGRETRFRVTLPPLSHSSAAATTA